MVTYVLFGARGPLGGGSPCAFSAITFFEHEIESHSKSRIDGSPTRLI